MLAAARHTAILDAVQREGVVKVADLAQRLGVSAVTIRRDIDALSDAGLLTRVHGGVMVPGEGGTHEPGFTLKSTQHLEAKEAMAMALIANDPKTHEWWALTDPCQQPVEGRSKGSIEGNWWFNMEELFHTD